MVVPVAGVNVPFWALKVPPVPEVRVQTPPVASLVIRLNRLMTAAELSHTEMEPFVPALAGGVMVKIKVSPVLLQLGKASL